jgi:hypothetical protein
MRSLPSFACQTVDPCGTCHTDFPALTPTGRRFKLLGYTSSGGAFRTMPFPVFPTANDSESAVEPRWGGHSLMVGTFGMHTEVNPRIDATFASGSMGTFGQTDKFTDVGFDTQYQNHGDNYWLTPRGSYIREFQRQDTTFATGESANPTNDLNSLKLQASFA